MGELTHKATRAAFGKAIELTLKHVEKDREKGLLQLVDLTEKFMGDNFPSESYEGARNLIRDPESKWMQYVNRALDEIHPNVIKQTALNLGFEAAFHGTKTIRAMRETHQCNIPWLILMDPTSACNLHCTGCWAAEYGHKLNLSYEDLDRIITQGKELGIYFYMYTGGEPLVRKADIIKLCEKHYDCEFHAFTNGTLVDDAFCEEMQRVGNLSLSISLEGFEEVNDLRRGVGVYDKVMAAMDKLKSHGLIFGTSICYTSKNIETVTSDEFLDMIIEKGCRFTWYFHYMPVGNEAAVDLLPTKEQRKSRPVKDAFAPFAICFRPKNRENICITESVRSVVRPAENRSMRWISRTMENSLAAASPEEETTVISMPMEMWNRVYLSITLLQISKKCPC